MKIKKTVYPDKTFRSHEDWRMEVVELRSALNNCISMLGILKEGEVMEVQAAIDKEIIEATKHC